MNHTGKDILAVPMNPETNDAHASSIRGYLVALLDELWTEQDGFSGKRPFGNSGWDDELHLALGDASLIFIKKDADGYLEECDCAAGDVLIARAIRALGETS